MERRRAILDDSSVRITRTASEVVPLKELALTEPHREPQNPPAGPSATAAPPPSDTFVAETGRLRFQSKQRVRTPVDYKRVYDLRHSVRDDCFLVFTAWNGLEVSRLGTSVSRKVGNSVVRHAWKRRIRETFRLLQHEIPAGLDLVIVPSAREIPDAPRAGASLKRLLERAVRRWPRPVAAETAPAVSAEYRPESDRL
ncbi:Ribonuclease P protein component [Planctomyces sp. SH-PL14]|nr:Ribonuclease P protein component [Planctomyces sp. SH-PL14]